MTNTRVNILSIYLTNLGKYNEGELLGEWVELPIAEDKLQEVFKRIGIDNKYYEEYFISDYESEFGIRVDEYDSVLKLNELAEQLSELTEYDLEIVSALLSEGYELQEAIEKIDDVFVYSDCNDMTDVAYAYIEETGMFNDVPENISNYFDYEAFGRDMSFEGQYIFTKNGNCIYIS